VKVVLKNRVKYDGKEALAGETHDLPDDFAKSLVEGKYASPATGHEADSTPGVAEKKRTEEPKPAPVGISEKRRG